MRPLTHPQVATIESTLADKSDWRSLAMFRLAIDTMLRASDLVSLTVTDVTDMKGDVLDQIVTCQQKTQTGVTSALSEPTREAVRKWLQVRGHFVGQWLFPGKSNSEHLTESQYRRKAKEWFRLAHLDTRFYSTHSLRRTKASIIFARTGNMEAVRQLLGHSSLQATSRYLGVETADAIRLAREIKI